MEEKKRAKIEDLGDDIADFFYFHERLALFFTILFGLTLFVSIIMLADPLQSNSQLTYQIPIAASTFMFMLFFGVASIGYGGHAIYIIIRLIKTVIASAGINMILTGCAMYGGFITPFSAEYGLIFILLGVLLCAFAPFGGRSPSQIAVRNIITGLVRHYSNK